MDMEMGRGGLSEGWDLASSLKLKQVFYLLFKGLSIKANGALGKCDRYRSFIAYLGRS